MFTYLSYQIFTTLFIRWVVYNVGTLLRNVFLCVENLLENFLQTFSFKNLHAARVFFPVVRNLHARALIHRVFRTLFWKNATCNSSQEDWIVTHFDVRENHLWTVLLDKFVVFKRWCSRKLNASDLISAPSELMISDFLWTRVIQN